MSTLRTVVREGLAILTLVGAAIVLAVMLSGCSAAGGRIGDVAPVGSTLLAFVEPAEYDDAERADVVEAVREIEAAWSSDFARRVPPVQLFVIDADDIECGGIRAIGCTRVDGTVHVVRGSRDELPAYYHELCHAARVSRAGMDRKHEDPGWATWDARGAEVSGRIAERRSWW